MSCQNLQSKIMNLWDTSLPIMFYITFKDYNTSSYAKAIKFTFLSCSSTTNQTNCPFWNISTVQDSIFTKPCSNLTSGVPSFLQAWSLKHSNPISAITWPSFRESQAQWGNTTSPYPSNCRATFRYYNTTTNLYR